MREFFAAKIEPTTCAVARATCTSTEMGPVIEGLFSTLVAQAGEAIQSGAPRLYYLEWTPERVVIEAAIPLEPGQSLPGVEMKTYPECTAFNTAHTGPYQGLSETWTELWREAQSRGMKGNGPPWDEYVTGAMDDPNPANWVTELYIPIDV